ncbi:MAG: hypothetical protein LBS56_00570 [Propionibacteriaceae bacterium]|jgi:hypothetical protein|nr:hypothetical protein [Propionibacteriaceae bacterium]
MVSASDVLRDRTGLDLTCLDRIYLNGYVPNLQVPGQVSTFMTGHLGLRVPSPAVLERRGQAFRDSVKEFAAGRAVPMIRFDKGVRKQDVARPYVDKLERAGRPGVAVIGVAQEFASVYQASKKTDRGGVWFSFFKQDRRVTCYHFYVFDPEFGMGFVKICSYFPYPMKLWVNGHEWAKRRAAREGLTFQTLSNGFAACGDPRRPRQICDSLSDQDVQRFADRWLAELPLPLGEADRAAGYWWEWSMRQIEVSRTIAFTQPRHARQFTEALITDNLDLGRPENLEIVFGRRLVRGPTRRTATETKTKLIRDGDIVTVNTFYKHSRVKQYLKDGRALRVETVVNDPRDLRVNRRLVNLDQLRAAARAVNDRLLDNETAGQDCVLADPAFERITSPTRHGRDRAPGLKFGDSRVQALAGALLMVVLAVTGLTNKSLRACVTALTGQTHTSAQASYDLRRLRLKGLVVRQPRSNTYTLTPEGTRFALFHTKLHDKLFLPLFAADHPPAPQPLRQALRAIDHHIDAYTAAAGLKPA